MADKSPDPLADTVVERIYGPKSRSEGPNLPSDEELIQQFATEPEKADIEQVAQALFRRLRRSL